MNLGAQAQCMVCLGARQCKRPVALFLEEEHFSRMLWNRTHVMVLTLKHSPFTQNQYRVEGKTKVLCQEVKGLLGMLSSASLQGSLLFLATVKGKGQGTNESTEPWPCPPGAF